MASYKVHFVFECSPETHWGIKNEDEVKKQIQIQRKNQD